VARERECRFNLRYIGSVIRNRCRAAEQELEAIRPHNIVDGGAKTRDTRAGGDRRQCNVDRLRGKKFLHAFFEPVNAFVEIIALDAGAARVAQIVGVRRRGGREENNEKWKDRSNPLHGDSFCF